MRRWFLLALLLAVLAGLVTSVALAQSPWTKQTTPTTQRIRGLKVVTPSILWASGMAGVVLRTVDGGANWVLKTAPASGFDIYCIEALDSLTAWAYGTATGVTVTGEVRIWKTTDGGTTWNQQYTNPDSYCDAIKFFDPNNGVAISDPSLTRKSLMLIVTTTNGGATWTQVPAANIPPVDSVADEVSVSNGCDVIGNSIWFSTYGNTNDMPIRVFKSTDKGLNWTASQYINIDNGYGISMKDPNTGILCNYNGQIARTSNNWAAWDTLWVLEGVFGLRAIEYVPGTNGIVAVGGPTNAGFSGTSTDGGQTWVQKTVPQGVGRLYAVSFVNESLGWAAGNGGAILKWTGSPVVGVEETPRRIPDAFALQQNYPNPFNPSTTIRYTVPKESFVEITVADLLGNQVATLVRGQHGPGSFSVKFDGSHLASGAYFYTMRAGDFISTKSFLLMK